MYLASYKKSKQIEADPCTRQTKNQNTKWEVKQKKTSLSFVVVYHITRWDKACFNMKNCCLAVNGESVFSSLKNKARMKTSKQR